MERYALRYSLMAAAVDRLPSQQPTGEEESKFADGYTHELNDNATSINNSCSLSRLSKHLMERTSNINNNNVWGKPLSQDLASDGILPSSSAQEIKYCTQFTDVKFPTLSTSTVDSKKHKKGAVKQDFQLEKPPNVNGISRSKEDAPTMPDNSLFNRIYSAASEKEAEREISTANFKDASEITEVQENKPLSVKERICNVGLSIEWIKSELTVMRAERFSLTQQFERLFSEIMDFKLKMEMEKDEDELIFEEDMYFES